ELASPVAVVSAVEPPGCVDWLCVVAMMASFEEHPRIQLPPDARLEPTLLRAKAQPHRCICPQESPDTLTGATPTSMMRVL
ncbi:MAG TPA: hypothetical protein VMV29_25075, partial [Ktedonobacterales bacterium]|nr:hypothetical protein [Ktedonobacterales bacterium]